MRGTHRLCPGHNGRSGIIPAYAGNTPRLADPGCRGRDHPRVCGEHALFAIANAPPLGSSPRMRGTHACPRKTTRNRMDHPRVCGEHWLPSCSRLSNWGSSPRMRGTHGFHAGLAQVFGIIPAYAGNTRCRTGFQAGCGDHPRVCGEHQLDALVGGIRTGSSPRMRGTLAPVIIGHVAHGIIPAYAGNTSCSMG